ncbi:protein kinase [Sphingomonas sp. NCPPB 2930]
MKQQNARTPLSTGTSLQEFEVRDILGSGGFGLVYTAYDTQLAREVALKEYFPSGIATRGDEGMVVAISPREVPTYAAGLGGFLYEARALAQFKHPGLAEIWRFWEQNGTAYIVMPKYSGSTMRQRIETDAGGCTEAWLRKVMVGMLSALETLHGKNLFHRDISPENIFILDNGNPVLLDLGATREATEHDSEALTITLKFGYAPIEQYSNDSHILQHGPWTDIYALCATAYFAITRKQPPTAVGRLINDTIDPLDAHRYPQFSPGFLSALRLGLQIRPEHRPQTIAALREALVGDTHRTAAAAPDGAAPAPVAAVPAPADFQPARPAAVPPSPPAPLQPVRQEAPDAPAEPRPSPSRRQPVPLAAAAAVALVAVVTGAALWLGRSGDPAAAGGAPVASAPVEGAMAPAAVPVAPPAAGSAPELPVPVSTPPPAVPPAAAPPAPTAAVPAAPATVTAADAPAPLAERATVVFNVLPWGNVSVDGRPGGVSPPLKRLQLAPGRYLITISSPGFENYSRTVELSKEQTVEISHTFE